MTIAMPSASVEGIQLTVTASARPPSSAPSGRPRCSSQPWDVYEGYLFSLATSTASNLGATVHHRDVNGNAVNNLVFRTSPGQLYSTTHPYTQAVLEMPGGREPGQSHSQRMPWTPGRIRVSARWTVCQLVRRSSVRSLAGVDTFGCQAR